MTQADKEWTSAQLFQNLVSKKPFFLLDVRSPEQFQRVHVEREELASIKNIPAREVLAAVNADRSILPDNVPIVAMCNMGVTSQRIAQALGQQNINVINFAGGISAWMSYYDIRPVVEDTRLSIYQVSRPARGCLSYVIASEGEALVIDPLRFDQPYLEFCHEKNLTLIGVLDTHGHADHLSSGPQLAAELSIPYYLHPEDAVHPFDKVKGDVEFVPLSDGQILSCGAIRLKVLHVPGHTLGNCALIADDKYLLAGDTIFLDSISRPDLGGQVETWSHLHYKSLTRLMDLSPSLRVLPGHFASIFQCDEKGIFSAELKDLVAKNPGLQQVKKGEEAFVAQIFAGAQSIPPNYIEIKRLNIQLKDADEQTRDELEMGRNECAARK